MKRQFHAGALQCSRNTRYHPQHRRQGIHRLRLQRRPSVCDGIAVRQTIGARDFAVAGCTRAGEPDAEGSVAGHDSDDNWDGYVTTDFGSRSDRANAVVVQPGAKIVVTWTGTAGNYLISRWPTVMPTGPWTPPSMPTERSTPTSVPLLVKVGMWRCSPMTRGWCPGTATMTATKNSPWRAATTEWWFPRTPR